MGRRPAKAAEAGDSFQARGASRGSEAARASLDRTGPGPGFQDDGCAASRSACGRVACAGSGGVLGQAGGVCRPGARIPVPAPDPGVAPTPGVTQLERTPASMDSGKGTRWGRRTSPGQGTGPRPSFPHVWTCVPSGALAAPTLSRTPGWQLSCSEISSPQGNSDLQEARDMTWLSFLCFSQGRGIARLEKTKPT